MEKLRESGVRFALTSGMACVHYGLQQTTKDSDWIVPAEDLEKLRTMFTALERALPPWRIRYREICGAPLEQDFMVHGWTSHLSIWDTPGSIEHKVDIFSKPPRVKANEFSVDEQGWATRHIVALMKRTDRDKDWPIVHGLGQQLLERNDDFGLLHVAEYESLLSGWKKSTPDLRAQLVKRRPMLRILEQSPGRLETERLFLLERLIWERVNQQRHGQYTRLWKEFYRKWRRDAQREWPNAQHFAEQHKLLQEAVRRHGLPCNPWEGQRREDIIQTALQEVMTLAAASQEELAKVCPPADELLV